MNWEIIGASVLPVFGSLTAMASGARYLEEGSVSTADFNVSLRALVLVKGVALQTRRFELW